MTLTITRSQGFEKFRTCAITSVVEWLEVAETFTVVDYVQERTAKMSCEFGENVSFRHVLFLLTPLLGAAWPIVYFLQGKLGMAANFARAYRFVCPAIVANISGVNSR